MKYLNLPWSPVVASHGRKRRTQALHSSRGYWL